MDKNNLTKEYSNGLVTIIWQSAKCIHSGNCIKNLPEVFNSKISPWIQPKNASDAEIVAAVNKCPSGAISIK
jgi:uncharacterized Fe-S cluster protein YjdI